MISALLQKKMLLIYNLEKEMATSHSTNVELRDPQSNYHKIVLSALEKEMPVLSWKTTLAAMDMHPDSVNVQQPKFFKKINELLKTTPVDTWKAYLEFNTISQNANGLSSDFVNAAFNYSKALSGQQVMKPRWDRIVASTDGNLGDALGEIYVKKYFSDAAKKECLIS